MKITYFSSADEILTELGRRIKQARIAMTITQKEMSERTNLSQRTISSLENGKDVFFTTVIALILFIALLRLILGLGGFALNKLFCMCGDTCPACDVVSPHNSVDFK